MIAPFRVTIGVLYLIIGSTVFGTVFTTPARGQDCTNPDGDIGGLVYNSTYDVFQGCTAGAGWVAFHEAIGFAPGPCAGSPSPGQTCADGSVYAGLSPDGNVPMFTTPADAPSLYHLNDGSNLWVDTAMVNCTEVTPGTAGSCQTGEANTAFLVGLSGSGSPAPYVAAEYCDGLSAHGHDDWYLPAQDELNVLYTNKNTGILDGTFDETGSFPAGFYWSSSEHNIDSARQQRFSDGSQSTFWKSVVISVRCVRK